MDKIKYIFKRPLYDKELTLFYRKCSFTVVGAKSGGSNFQNSFNQNHLETNNFQKSLLGIGSAIVSLANPRRGDMIAALGETTGLKSLEYIRSKMNDSEEGRKILNDKPRISTETVDLQYLSTLKEETIGKSYYNFLNKYNYSPDGRLAVRFVDDLELAYVIQRYREVHDLFHTILNMPTNMLGEVTVKWVEAVQTRLPMCAGGALFGAARLSPKYIRNFSTLQRPENTVDNSMKINEELEPKKKNLSSLRMPCIELPQDLSSAIRNIIRERNLPDLSEKSRYIYNYLHSRTPPLSSEDLKLLKASIKAEVYDSLPENSENKTEDEKKLQRHAISCKVSALVRSRVYHWKPLVYDDSLSFYYLAARSSADYAVVSRVLNEIKQRDHSFSPKNIFDFGSGVGSVSWVANNFWGNSISEHFTVDSSTAMHDLARLILQLNNPQNKLLITNLFQRQFLPSTARRYDIVISSYSLMELESMKARADVILNLWAKTEQYLIVIEQGTNAGFKLINEVRNIVLHASEVERGDCHIFAPCSHEMMCPKFDKLQLETPCNFHVKYMDIFNRSSSKKERFSFVILKRGARDERNKQFPRVVKEVLLRNNHTICRLCTKNGKFEEIIITKSKHGKDLYKQSRAFTWGDVIPIETTSRSSEENCESSKIE